MLTTLTTGNDLGALDILEAEGLIDRVRGGGAFIHRYSPS
jgi:DNA-binding GntR family transcriptional regulator